MIVNDLMKICMKIVAWDIIDDLPAPDPDELMQLLSNAELKKNDKKWQNDLSDLNLLEMTGNDLKWIKMT